VAFLRGRDQDQIECPLRKLAIDTKLCGVVDTLERRDAIQREVGPCNPWEVQQGQMQGPAHGSGQPQAQIQAEWRVN